jgi:predicted patatin/cPLA2 family phospholipase
VCATDITTGDLRYFSSQHIDFWKCVLASASFPIFFPQTEIEGIKYSDGAQIHNIALGQAIRLGATDVHMIAATNPYENYVWAGKQSILSLLRRTIDVMTEQMTKSDIETTGVKNDLTELNEKYKHVKVQTVFFDGSERFDTLEFDGKKIDEMIDLGYNQALTALLTD